MTDEGRRQGGMRRVVAMVVVAAIVAVAAIAGSIWGGRGYRAVRGWLGDSSGSASSAGSPATGATAAPTPSATAAGASDAASATTSSTSASASASALGVEQLAAQVGGGSAPTAAAVKAVVAKVSTKSLGTVSGYVMNPATGAVLYDSLGAKALLPASTNKVLTCTTVLATAGPWTRFTTKVVSPAKGRIVLVGGGDPLLASTASTTYPSRPTTAQLAAGTAAALKKQGVTQVSLSYDDTLFSGPAWNSSWPASYKDQVGAVSALMVDEGASTRAKGSAANPAAAAATVFATQLKAAGIKVTGSIARAKAASGASQLASVQSLPVATLVQQTLLHSDNMAAEVLSRQAALASHRAGSFTGGTQAVQAELTSLKLWTSSARLRDGSGLSRGNAVTAAMLAGAIRADMASPQLSPLLDGLPTAGITGTLVSRFYTSAASAGRGVVHVKTGTLTHVSTFAGYTTTKSGTPLVFAFMVNGASPTAEVTAKTSGTNDWSMRNYLDTVSSTLATLP